MSTDKIPTGYDELISVLDSLPLLVRETRRRRGLSLRAAAPLVGVESTTIHRCEQGDNLRLNNAVALLRWVGSPDGPAGIR